mmetsp:Transcript_17301/g.47958  ORF Transcript_17301/g.47958 Transcript_17301/m.47958 type:complete len:211 (-) Transcript_17301:1454-2086(-)
MPHCHEQKWMISPWASGVNPSGWMGDFTFTSIKTGPSPPSPNCPSSIPQPAAHGALTPEGQGLKKPSTSCRTCHSFPSGKCGNVGIHPSSSRLGHPGLIPSCNCNPIILCDSSLHHHESQRVQPKQKKSPASYFDGLTPCLLPREPYHRYLVSAGTPRWGRLTPHPQKSPLGIPPAAAEMQQWTCPSSGRGLPHQQQQQQQHQHQQHDES